MNDLPSTSSESYNIDHHYTRRTQNAVNDHYIGAMNINCEHCGAKHFKDEKVPRKGNSFNDCCSHGAVILDKFSNFPEELKSLFLNTHEKSSVFFERIRAYNSSLSFASFNANLVNFNNRRPGPFCFKIHGQIHYQINTSLYPTEGENPTYGQLFILDQHEAIEHRINCHSELDRELIHLLHNLISTNNVFAHSYQMMNEEVQRFQERDTGSAESLQELQMTLSLKPGAHPGRYNVQRVNEVAAIFLTTADGEIPDSFVTIRNKQTKELQCIISMDPNVEPWIYPLFYPLGTKGWHKDLERQHSDRRISRNAYIKYLMAIRSDFNPIIRGRGLYQQWVVFEYVAIERDRIQYCKDNQKQLRAESYQGLMDYLKTTAEENQTRVGKVVVLPSTFIDSPRNMMQNYQDSMSIVRKFRKPDLFITMTCNPNWREITENLLPGQTASDRSDLVTRVFNIKKDHLIDLIKKKHFFGRAVAHVGVIEFQKRGLPHVHLLVTLAKGYKLNTPEKVDRYICAEIPDRYENSKLHHRVLTHMIHGPCGRWCLSKNNKCSKNFPMAYTIETLLDEEGYPQYKCRNTGIYYEKGNFIFDNQYVVPYNPELLLIFDCHINVVAVSSIRFVKYLYKYIYKGHDAASVSITDSSEERSINHDEIKSSIETRYAGPSEACWRILNKSLQDKSHSIIRLTIHLPNEHTVIIDGEGDNNDIQNALTEITMLLDYFELNKRDEMARELLYIDIPPNYTFTNNKWNKRKNFFNVVGRIYSVSPTQVELFHLRLLILNVKGATSFTHLRTVDNIVYPTFVDACKALGLIEDDEEWRKASREAAIWMMPRRLRRLFVRILIHCHPLYPDKLWLEFKDEMSEDYSRRHNLGNAHKKAYADINCALISEVRSLSDFPRMEQTVDIIANPNDLTIEEYSEIGQQQYLLLNQQQKEIVDTILEQISSNSENRCIYINGPGGSGKTFIYTTIYYILTGKEKKISNMAFTGIAAILLPKGKTVHKTFGLPVPLHSDSSSNIKLQSKAAQELKETDVFIWDEAPMAPRYALEIIDKTLRDIMNNNLPFGGKIIVLGGDFRQLLPIKINATQNKIVNLSIKYSQLWNNFKVFNLTQNMRVLPNEVEFMKFLLDVGDGSLNDDNNYIQIDSNCLCSEDDNIVEDIYGNLIWEKKYDGLSKSAILAPRNVDVDEINAQVVDLLDPSTEHLYPSIDSIQNCDNGEMAEALLPEYLNSLNPNSLPPYELRLRKHCIVMLLRNISINEGLCNGTRLRILDFATHLLKCEILTGDKAGEIVFLNRITLYSETDYPFTFQRRQFPIKLAFAMTINKSQGQTFYQIGIHLHRDVFTHGQLYVALSRVKSKNGLKVYTGSNERKSIKNYVFQEILH